MINWDELQKLITPIKDYEDLCQRAHTSFSYPFVRKAYDLTLPELANYTQRLLGGDPKGRYTEYATLLTGIITKLHQAGVNHVLELNERTGTRQQLELFTRQTEVPALDTAALLKFLIYWFIPGEKYLSSLVRNDDAIISATHILLELGVRTNLQILQAGITPAGRVSLSETSGLPPAIIVELVNRADFSRLPWASKATISNIIGAGYASLAQLSSADPQQLHADFFRYGKSIGKNLKLGNEIENSYRISKIIPELMC